MVGGEGGLFRAVLKLRRMKIVFNLGKIKKFFESYLNPLLYLLKIVFPKFNPLTVTGWLYVLILGQNVKIYSASSETKRNQV
jgi:hypothetical protein